MNTSERSSHPALAQIETLVEFLERNPGLAKGHIKTQSARERSRRLWEQIALRLNSMGGTVKSQKQWCKYWSDKKSAIKKKAAARAAARRKTGGGVEEIVELTDVEERILALLGGDGFFTGDAHLGIQPFKESIPSTSPQQIEISQETATSGASIIPQQRSPASEEVIAAMVLEPEQHDEDEQQRPEIAQRRIVRRLFDSGKKIPVAGTSQSQSILNDFIAGSSSHNTTISSIQPSPSQHRTLLQKQTPHSVLSPTRHGTTSRASHAPIQMTHPCLSPPNPTLSRTPTPLSFPRHPSHTSSIRAHPVPSTVSPSRRGSTPQGSRAHRRRARARQGVGSSTSRQAGSVATQAEPPSQRRTEFSRITERFLRVEEQQLEIQQSYARLLETVLESSTDKDRNLVEAVTIMGERMVARITERDRIVAEAISNMGEGLKALAEVIKCND